MPFNSNTIFYYFYKISLDNQLSHEGDTTIAPGNNLPIYPVPDLNFRWAPSAGTYVNGSTMAIGTFIPALEGIIEDTVSSSPSKPPPRPKLRLDIPVFTNNVIQAISTKTVNLFEDSDPELMAVATTLNTPTPILLTNLTSSTFINSTQTHSIYVNVSKTSRLLRFAHRKSLDDMFGPGLTHALALQLCDYADKWARPHTLSTEGIPLTPPSKLFSKRKLESSHSSPTTDAPASADSSSGRHGARAAAAIKKNKT